MCRMWRIWLLICLCSISCWGLAQELLPQTQPGVQVVTAQQLAQGQRVPKGTVVVDTRALHDFLAGRIPGSVHVAYKERSIRRMDFNAAEDDVDSFLQRLRKFVPNLHAPVLFYCNGTMCWKSWKASRAAIVGGYVNVFWLRGGMAEWEAQGLPLERE